MALSVRLTDPGRLYFENLPDDPINYLEEIPNKDPTFIELKVIDAQTKQTKSVFLKPVDLQDVGLSWSVWESISSDYSKLSQFIRDTCAIKTLLQRAIPIVARHLDPLYLSFFQNTTFASRVISHFVYSKIAHTSKVKDVPGMYFHSVGKAQLAFINLKKTRYLGQGSYGRVRKAIWINPPNKTPEIVAKKVWMFNNQPDVLSFHREIQALQTFQNQTGIISLIAAVVYKEKRAAFLPLYDCSLETYLVNPPFPLTIQEKLSVVSQWLKGLATISQKGIHGDIKFQNLLLRRGDRGIEGVISDFGAYCSADQAVIGLTPAKNAPPEYHKNRRITLKHDVWGMGLVLHYFFSDLMLPIWDNLSEREVIKLISELTPGWSIKYPTRPDTPPMISELIHQMLDPRIDLRPTPTEVFDRFSIAMDRLPPDP